MQSPQTHGPRREFAGAAANGALSERVMEEIRGLPSQFPEIRSAVMPALDLAQEELGYLTPEAMSDVAAALDLDPGYVEGVATFYTLFHTEPIGRHRLYLCTNLSCKLRGADDLVEHALAAIGVTEQCQVSPDGLFSVEAVECLGACEYAPMMRLDHEYHYDLTPDRIDALLAARRQDRAAAAATPAPAEEKPKKPRAPRRKKAESPSRSEPSA